MAETCHAESMALQEGADFACSYNSATLAGLEAAFVWEATDRNRGILFLDVFGIHAKLNMSTNQVSLTLVL